MTPVHKAYSQDTEPGRVTIIGAGHVGAATAYARLFQEILLIDADEALARAETADISDANALARLARIFAGGGGGGCRCGRCADRGSHRRRRDARLRKPPCRRGAKRCDRVLVRRAVDGGRFQGDIGLRRQSRRCHGLGRSPALGSAGGGAVIGPGTLLDSCRMRQRIAAALDLAPGSVEAMHRSPAAIRDAIAGIGALTAV